MSQGANKVKLAQPTPKEAAAATKDTAKAEAATPEPPKTESWRTKFKPAAGGFLAMAVPVTGIQEYIGLGFGAETFFSADFGHFFIPADKKYQLRGVLSASGYYLQNKASAVSATLLLFPVIFSAEASYLINPHARVLGRLGAGTTFDVLKINDSSVTKATDSSVSFAYQFDLGAGYRLGNLELLLLAGYLGELQTVSASFVTIRVGASWSF